MMNPAGFTAVQIGPGQVRLSWQSVRGASFYGVFGPGLTPGGEKIAGATTTVIASNVPPGNQQWAVGSFYDPGNASTSANAFPRVSLNVTAPLAPTPASPPAPPSSTSTTTTAVPATPPPSTPPPTTPPPTTPAASGRYLVTITGLRAYQASMDDLLSRDGVGDEVYAAAYVRRYNRQTGQIAETNVRQSATYGDVKDYATQRVQGGTRSLTGGIQDGDPLPDGPAIAVRTLPAQNAVFPLRLWEGTLTSGVDALVITPSLWEQDNFTPLGGTVSATPTTAYYSQWVQQQTALNQSLFTHQKVQSQMVSQSFDPIVAGVSGNNSGTSAASLVVLNADLMFIGMFTGVSIGTFLSSSADRPIGLVANDRDSTALPNKTVVLTREIIEAALARPALGVIPSPLANVPPNLLGIASSARTPVAAPKPGIMVLQFQDVNLSGALAFPERPAIYQMFIQVERVP
jgi:hypothetical protein